MLAADRAYFSDLQARLPVGTRIAQLPHIAYPEGGGGVANRDYVQFRPYLHTRSFRWSFGALKGTEGDRWLGTTSRRLVDESAFALADLGARYDGILINRPLSAAMQPGLEVSLQQRLGAPLLASAEFAYFSLSVDP